MKLKAVLESLDGLDESLKGLYSKNEHGEFVLDLDGVDSHPAVRGLKAALETSKSQRTKLREKLDAFGDMTAEELQELVEFREAQAAGGGGGGGKSDDVAAQLQQLKEKLEGKHTKESEKLTSRIEALQKALESRVVDGELDRAIAAKGFKEDLRPAVRALLKERKPTMVEDDDGNFVGVFKTDLSGIPGDHSIGDFVDQWSKTDDAAAYIAPTGRTGSGADGNKRPAGGDGKFVTEQDLAEGTFDLEALAKGQVEVVGG